MADLDASATVVDRGLEVTLKVSAGEVVAVLGPNGAGKSTTMSVIAGLLAADHAVVRVGDRVLTDTERGVFVPVYQRRIGLLMQEPLLFGRMSVVGNVVFAASRAARGKADARRRALHWLERVGAADLVDRAPAQLSGGQEQRVALARAMAAEPEVLLLDEPFAGLDVIAAAAIRSGLRTLLAGGDRPTVLITHDLLDVVGLADRIVILEDGRVAEAGPVSAVLAAPRSEFGATFAGVNVVGGVIEGPAVLRSGDNHWHGTPAAPLRPGDDAVAVFSPSAVAVFRERPHGSPRNCVRTRVVALEVVGAVVRVRATEPADGSPSLIADITAEAVADIRLGIGDDVWFTVKTQEVYLHPARRS